MIIQHNIAALNSYRNLTVNNSGVSKNLEKLSSGYRINRAGDDAAGLAISEKMRSQITGLETAEKNSNDAISLVQTAEGALTEVHTMLNRMVEIATQSANGVYDDNVDRAALQDELDSLRDEIDRISEGTNFNKQNLLDGSVSDVTTFTFTGAASADAKEAGIDLRIDFDGQDVAITGVAFTIGTEGVAYAGGTLTITLTAGEDYTATDIKELLSKFTNADKDLEAAITGANVVGLGIIDNVTGTTGIDGNEGTEVTYTDSDALELQIGDTNDDFNKLNVSVRNMSAEALGLSNISIKDQDDAGEAIAAINAAINSVSTQRGELGAVQNRLEHTINNLNVNVENMTAAESRIRDVDMAEEMMAYTKNNILVQASQAMLAQANQVPQGVLQLLQ